MSYIRDLEHELAELIDSLSPQVVNGKDKDWYAWRDRLISFVVKKVYESYRNGREGITDTGGAAPTEGRIKVEPQKAPTGHGSHHNGPHGNYTSRGVAVNPQSRQPAWRQPADRTSRSRANRR